MSKQHYKKSILTQYAKETAFLAKQIIDVICLSEEISKIEISGELDADNELLLEVSKNFAKFANDEMHVDLENGEVQKACDLINTIVGCCEKNNWFKS